MGNNIKLKHLALAAIFCTGTFANVEGQEINGGETFSNPVIKGIADCGVLRYAGNYYIGGVNTLGDVFISNDLVHWDRKAHVFDLDNDWTHGTGAKNNQIHANDFTFQNGVFHLLFSVNYWGDDKHIVHITHATSSSPEGPYLEGRKDQWFDNRIDPNMFVDDDGRAYLYNVKFTEGNTIWGRPLDLSNNKLSTPVWQFSSQPGTWETLDSRVAEGPYVIKYRDKYYMMYNANHTAAEIGHYRLGVCEADSPLGFNPGGKYSAPVVVPETEVLNDNATDLIAFGSGSFQPVDLSKDTIQFSLEEVSHQKLFMKIVQRGGCKLHINGTLINGNSANDLTLFPVDYKLLKKGMNSITVEKPSSSSRLISLALYLPDKGFTPRTGDLLVTPGQPTILRGPNGWEWWLVYMANEGWRRNQMIDRVHFVNSHLWVDGITGAGSPGFHPSPAMPKYKGTSLDSVAPGNAFVLEATFTSSSQRQGLVVGGKEFVLPESLTAGVPHTWRIERNFDLVSVWVDHNLLVKNVSVPSSELSLGWMDGKKPDHVEFISYTDGWDEHTGAFSGWKNLEKDEQGNLVLSGNDIKGDAAVDYEWSVQLSDLLSHHGGAGIYAAYWGSEDYIKSYIETDSNCLVIDNCRKGKHNLRSIKLDDGKMMFPDIKYTDGFEKQYRFDALCSVSSLEWPVCKDSNDDYLTVTKWGQPDNNVDLASRLQGSWLDGDTWRPLQMQVGKSDRAGWQRVDFPEVKTTAIRLINSGPHDGNNNVYRINAFLKGSDKRQLRVERRGKSLYYFVDTKLVHVDELKNSKPAKVGLCQSGDSNAKVLDTFYYVVY